MESKSELIDPGENGLQVSIADEDGIQITETESGNAVYIYFQELPLLIPILKELYDEHK